MNEKIFKSIQSAGIWNLVIGIVVLVTGIAGGVLLLVNAARLLKTRNGMMI